MEILSQQNLAVTIFLCQADPAGPTDQHGSEQHINQCYTTLLAPQPCKVHIIIPVNLIHWVCFVLPDTARSALHQGPAAARPLCCRQASVFFFVFFYKTRSHLKSSKRKAAEHKGRTYVTAAEVTRIEI